MDNEDGNALHLIQGDNERRPLYKREDICWKANRYTRVVIFKEGLAIHHCSENFSFTPYLRVKGIKNTHFAETFEKIVPFLDVFRNSLYCAKDTADIDHIIQL